MLRIDEEGRVYVVPEAIEFPEIQAVIKKDKSQGKKYYNRVIKYVYHAYTPELEHPLVNYSPMMRVKRVCELYFDGESPETFEKDKLVRSLIDRFTETMLLPNQRFYEELKNDMEELKSHISQVPWVKKVREKHRVKIPTNDGEQEVEVMIELEIDNSQEKFAALERAVKLLNLERQIRLAVLEEVNKAKKEGFNYLFDRR